ncbi:hypothetical protein IFR05_014548 [Cadophora sp. M221]|nr:hypothetical protein IFR05_014548 [Cadophora sp. M221]
MLQQDMTGFYNSTVEKRKDSRRMMDMVHEPVMEYLKVNIAEYTKIPWVETGGGPRYGSDHRSDIQAGYLAAIVIEGAFDAINNHIHGSKDSTEYTGYDYMIDYSQLTLSFLYELAFADL